MPQKAGELYHIVAMSWLDRWKKYTDYDKVNLTTETSTPMDID